MINQRNENGQPHGYWEHYYSNGKLDYKGNYINGERDGYWEYYHSNSKIWNNGYFINDKRNGYFEWYSYKNGKSYKKEFYII